MAGPAKIDISELIDNTKLGAFQLGVCILCGVCLMMDGFDVQAIGYVAPAITQDWKIPPPTLGPVLSAALVGVLFGSLLLSMLADKIGRRPVLIGSCLFFSLVTLLTARVQTVGELLTVRFIAGLGLGSIMPNAMALVSEYTPRRLRVATMMIVSNGFTAGAALGGFLAAWLIPSFGWRSVFYFGGVLPLVIGILMFFMLPESLQFLVLKGRNLEQVSKWLKRIDPAAVADRGGQPEYLVHEKTKRGFLFVRLFEEHRAVGTILLWLIYFLNLLNLYFLSSWLPTVAKAAGYTTRAAVLVGTMEQVGGMIGAIALGWFVHRFGFVPVLTACFVVGCVNIGLIGQPGLSGELLFLVVFIAGFGVVGGQAGVNALAAVYYPTDLRSTGVGFGLGVGRVGGIVGPIIAGILLGLKWSSHQLFLAAAVPALLSAVLMLGMRWVLKPGATTGAKSEVMVH
jgi:MFS transporter, AAHS family, 4-hydroxybenzoate transporter